MALRALRDIDVVQDLAVVGWFDPFRTIRFLDTLGEVVLAPRERKGAGYPATPTARRQLVNEVLGAHAGSLSRPFVRERFVRRSDLIVASMCW